MKTTFTICATSCHYVLHTGLSTPSPHNNGFLQNIFIQQQILSTVTGISNHTVV